jgi:hypothetical protein
MTRAVHANGVTLPAPPSHWPELGLSASAGRPDPHPGSKGAAPAAPLTNRLARIKSVSDDALMAALRTSARHPRLRHYHNPHPELGHPTSLRGVFTTLLGDESGYSPQISEVLAEHLNRLTARGHVIAGHVDATNGGFRVFWPTPETSQ